MESISLDFTETPVENRKYGERMKFDAAGPYQKKRSRTDFCWCVGLYIYVIIWVIVMLYASSAGDTSKWLKPRDSAGRICGYDLDVIDKPYLVHYDSDKCEMPHCLVCRFFCPENDFDYFSGASSNVNSKETSTESVVVAKQLNTPSNSSREEAKPQTQENSNDPKNQSEEKAKTEADAKAADTKTNNNEHSQESITTTTEETKTDNSVATAEVNTAQSKDLGESRTTSQPSDETTDDPRFSWTKEMIICQNDVKLDLVSTWDELDYLVKHRKCSEKYRATRNIYDYRCDIGIPDVNVTASDEWRQTLPYIVQDLSNANNSIMGFIMLSGLIALASIFLMRWSAMVYVCISIFMLCALAFHFIYKECVLSAENKTNGVLLALFLGVVVLVLIVLIAIYFRRQLSLACHMIKESSKAITCVLSSLTVPFICCLVYMFFFVSGIKVFYLLTTLESPVYRAEFVDGETCECPSELAYTQNSSCNPDTFKAECRKKSGELCVLSGCYMIKTVAQTVGFMHLINFFGLIWTYWFLSGFNDTVLASVFSIWYWTFNKKMLSYLSVVESFWTVSFYHLGTVALGSLMIAVCATIRMILNTTRKSLEKINRPFSALILLNLQCVFDLSEKIFNFINRRAYIMCAMHGTDFFQSARTAYYLLMRNVGRVISVVTVTSWLTFLTSILIAGLTTGISISYYESMEEYITFRHIPPTIIFFGSYVMTCLIMRSVEVAVDTIFQCFLEDTERNDGTNEKPYFMSEELTKFLYKK